MCFPLPGTFSWSREGDVSPQRLPLGVGLDVARSDRSDGRFVNRPYDGSFCCRFAERPWPFPTGGLPGWVWHAGLVPGQQASSEWRVVSVRSVASLFRSAHPVHPWPALRHISPPARHASTKAQDIAQGPGHAPSISPPKKIFPNSVALFSNP